MNIANNAGVRQVGDKTVIRLVFGDFLADVPDKDKFATLKTMHIREAIAIAFKAIGKEEISVGELAEYVKSSIADYKNIDLAVVKRKVNAEFAINMKSKTPVYAKAINPKTKKSKKGIYRLAASPKKHDPIFRISPTPQSLPFPVIPTPKPPKGRGNTKYVTPKPPKEGGNTIDKDFTDTKTKNLYFGKGGEFAVASELIFHGYNASIMSVDEGIDITASKENSFFFIQVKSTWLDDKKRLSVTLKPNRFQNATSASLYYIIVIRYASKGVLTNRYIIFSQDDLLRYKYGGFIKNTTSGLAIKIKEEAGQLWLYDDDKKHGIEYHLDRFELIK